MLGQLMLYSEVEQHIMKSPDPLGKLINARTTARKSDNAFGKVPDHTRKARLVLGKLKLCSEVGQRIRKSPGPLEKLAKCSDSQSEL